MYDFDSFISRENTGAIKLLSAPDAVRRAGVTPLSIADMEFAAAPEIAEALHAAVSHGICGYTDVDDEYFEAVAEWQQKRHGFKVDMESLAVSPGVVAALGTAVRAFSEKGDGVIIQPPVYPPFWNAIRDNERVILQNRLIYENGRYEMDFDDLERLAKAESTKLLILCSPHNPVGRVWTADELARLGDICKRNGVFVIADEIHQDIVFPGHEHTVFAKLPGMAENCMICTAMSKTFNLAGLSCSNIFVPDKARYDRFFETLHRDSTIHVPFFARAAAIAAFTKGGAWVDEMLEYVEGNFNLMYDFIEKRLPELKCIRAEGTYLAWVDMRALGLSDEALERLVVDKGLLALDEGYIFGTGGSGFERWNIALPRTQLQNALERLERAVRGV